VKKILKIKTKKVVKISTISDESLHGRKNALEEYGNTEFGKNFIPISTIFTNFQCKSFPNFTIF